MHHKWIVALFVLFVVGGVANGNAQITVPRKLSAQPDFQATLEERLINKLKATTEQQKAFVRFVNDRVRDGKLDLRLVLAIERYAARRSPVFPILYFERAIRFEAGRRGVTLPPLQQFATTKIQ
ncbi:MAG: hypothetical protein AAGA03_05590 [Planctomycetota bacterium]